MWLRRVRDLSKLLWPGSDQENLSARADYRWYIMAMTIFKDTLHQSRGARELEYYFISGAP